MLKQRILTAIALALVFSSTIFFFGEYGSNILFSAGLFISIRELFALTIKPEKSLRTIISVLLASLFWLFNVQSDIWLNFYFSFIGSLVWICILCFMVRYKFNGQWTLQIKWLHFLMGLVLLWICATGLLFVQRHFDSGGWILLYTLTLIWVADIGAYFVGKRFGRNKLASGISPGKTWEGVIGGIVCNLVWMCFVFLLSNGWDIVFWQFIVIGLFASALSVVGDLYESILKREAGVKDSGTLLPGHGGVLDRIDGVIAATPVFIFGLYVVGAI